MNNQLVFATPKKNQSNLYEQVEKLFQDKISTGFQGIQHSTYKTEEVGHGVMKFATI